jgi:hypothetical protein
MIDVMTQTRILSVAEVIDELDLQDGFQRDVWNEVFDGLGLPYGEDMTLDVRTQCGTVIPIPLDSFLGLGDDGTLEVISDGAVIRVDPESVIVAKSTSTLSVTEVEYPRLAA